MPGTSIWRGTVCPIKTATGRTQQHRQQEQAFHLHPTLEIHRHTQAVRGWHSEIDDL